MKSRYGIHAKKAWGVPVDRIKALGKRLGHDHRLARASWALGVSICVHLFDRVPHALAKVAALVLLAAWPRTIGRPPPRRSRAACR